MRRKRTLLFLACCLALIPGGCSKSEPLSPVDTVKRFHQLSEKGEWESAIALVDIGDKCARMLGELYTQGQPEDQAAMRDIWQRKLIASTTEYLDKHFGESLGTVSQTGGDETHAVVQQEKGKFRLIYSLELKDGAWIIVDRGHELDGIRPNPKRSIEVILRRIENEMGRKPTLPEVNARLEEYMDRFRVRQIKVEH